MQRHHFVIRVGLIWAGVFLAVLAAAFCGVRSVGIPEPGAPAQQGIVSRRTIKAMLRPFAKESRR